MTICKTSDKQFQNNGTTLKKGVYANILQHSAGAIYYFQNEASIKYGSDKNGATGMLHANKTQVNIFRGFKPSFIFQ